MYIYIFRTYYFALKIILIILNKATQYISFVSITLFITCFLLIKQGLFIYEDIFINSLKGLYPEFITSSKTVAGGLESLYNKNITVKDEVFVHSEEIEFSYEGEKDITKYMNVRTFDEGYKKEIFSTLTPLGDCKEDNNTIWMSSRLYDNLIQDTTFNQKSLFFKNESDAYISYKICTFKLDNNEKWLLISNDVRKNIAYLPFPKKVIYTENQEIKEFMYNKEGVDNWKKYIDYDDLGVFLLAKEISSTFLTTFFVFLITFMIIAFSSLAKEFEASIFLIKLYGLNIYRTFILYTFFFLVYTAAILLFVYGEYTLIAYLLENFFNFPIMLDYQLFGDIFLILVLLGACVSLFISLKYHRLPL